MNNSCQEGYWSVSWNSPRADIKQEDYQQGQILHEAFFMPINNVNERRPAFFFPLQPQKERFQVSPAHFHLDLPDDRDFHFYWSFLYPRNRRTLQFVKEQMYTLLTTDTTL